MSAAIWKPSNMELVATESLPATADNDWPWALLFVLLGWMRILMALCKGCCKLCLTLQATRRAMEGGRAWKDQTCPCCSTCVGKPSRSTQTSPVAARGREEDPWPKQRSTTPERRCTYPTHKGSPDLVKAMACRARPILLDMGREASRPPAAHPSCPAGR